MAQTDTVYVWRDAVVLHAAPDTMSRVVDTLAYGDTLHVIRELTAAYSGPLLPASRLEPDSLRNRYGHCQGERGRNHVEGSWLEVEWRDETAYLPTVWTSSLPVFQMAPEISWAGEYTARFEEFEPWIIRHFGERTDPTQKVFSELDTTFDPNSNSANEARAYDIKGEETLEYERGAELRIEQYDWGDGRGELIYTLSLSGITRNEGFSIGYRLGLSDGDRAYGRWLVRADNGSLRIECIDSIGGRHVEAATFDDGVVITWMSGVYD